MLFWNVMKKYSMPIMMLNSGKLNFSLFSGSTCVSVMFIGPRLYCANVGDSRAILLRNEEHCRNIL